MEPPTGQPAARPAHDAAYKLLFSQPRMVQDLPIVLYNGSRPWTAAEDVTELIAGGEETAALRTMFAETMQQWRAEDREQGRKEGHRESIAQGIEVVCRMAARKFAAETAPRLSALLELEGETDPERLAQVGEWIIECETGDDLLARVHAAS